MDDNAAYHPSSSGAGNDPLPATEGMGFPSANTDHVNTIPDHTGIILQQTDLGDPAATAAAAAAAAAIASTPLDSSQPAGPSPLSLSAKSHKNIEKLVCQVDDCRAPLEGLKDYHQRYKVCDTHLKIAWIEREGRKVRFCQQCGRFQLLEEFDSMKRSCRARLQKHNARRRKRTRDGGDGNMNTHDSMDIEGIGSGGNAYHHHQQIGHQLGALHHDPAAAAAIAAGFNGAEVAAMQEAMQFASATLMQTTAGAQNAAVTGIDTSVAGMVHPPNVDVGAATASASIAGMPFGGTLQSMPFIPSKEVMTLLLKGYAGMFHYNIEHIGLRPRAQPTTMEELAAPMEAAAVAAAAAMTVANAMPGRIEARK